MSLLQHAPALTPTDAVRLARDVYGLDVSAAPLPSERDQNFRLTTSAGEQFVLKIANGRESLDLLQAQNAAIERLASTRLTGTLVPATSGESRSGKSAENDASAVSAGMLVSAA